MRNHLSTTESVPQSGEEELRFDFQQVLEADGLTCEPQSHSDDNLTIEGIVIGQLVDVDADGKPAVEFDGNLGSMPLAATTTVAVTPTDVGRQAALMFQNRDPGRPVLIGLVHEPIPAADNAPIHHEIPLTVQADQERIELKADREIVLKCGQASITLTRAGKIILRGAYLLSRSSGVNRIKGGSVQIN